MGRRIERLVYVHVGEPGKVGEAIRECGGMLAFNAEGSGLIHLDETGPEEEVIESAGVRRTVHIGMQRVSQLSPMLVELVGDDAPCIVAMGNGTAEVVVTAPSLRRCQGTANDLRGKIRFGAARIGWSL